MDRAQLRGFTVHDLGGTVGTPSDYPLVAHQVALRVLDTPGGVGILVCGTGLGMSYTANRHPRIRAALCRSSTEARLARGHNDANILVLGGRITGTEIALDIFDQFFSTPFEGGRHLQRIELIDTPA